LNKFLFCISGIRNPALALLFYGIYVCLVVERKLAYSICWVSL
jgi:hypothetical protein